MFLWDVCLDFELLLKLCLPTTGDGAEPVVAKRGAQQKKPAKKVNGAGSDDEDYVAENAKPEQQKKKQTKKASAPVDEDEDDMPTLKARIAAFTLNDSSPDSSAMETETTEEQNEDKGVKGPSRRGGGKKLSSSLAVISDDEDDDVDFAMEVPEVQAQKKGRGRKTAAATQPKAAATRKRAPAKGKAMMLKTTEDSNTGAPSPEKKVRKMRASPFNKKSGSILQRGSTASSSEITAEASPPSGSSAEPVAAPQPRRTARATTSKPVYISESDPEDEVVEVTDDSDFDVDGDSDDE
jgi:DNA topoisomerase-2